MWRRIQKKKKERGRKEGKWGENIEKRKTDNM